MKSTVVIITIFLLVQPVFAWGDSPKEPQNAYVKHVFDGDTVLVWLNRREEKVRLLGIDTPEKNGPYTKAEFLGATASDRTCELALAKKVTLIFGGDRLRDRYGRLLAYVILPDGKSLNEILLQEGLARAYKKFRHDKKQDFIRLEREAKKRGIGIWATQKRR